LIPPLKVAAASFFAYSILAGLIVPPTGVGLSPWLNSEWFHQAFGVPVQLFRLLVVVPMAMSIMKVLEIFDREAERRLEEAETQRAILNERLRISRDLHDGVMQSIYGVGLALENVTFLMGENQERARQNLERSMVRLNDTIQEIRGYILNLRPARAGRDELYAGLLEVVAKFRTASAVRLRLNLELAREVKLKPETVDEVCHIVREALTNVARHAQAREARLEARRTNDGWLELAVRDDGQGFLAEEEKAAGKQGLGNMRERAGLLGGSLSIVSRRGWGTEVALRLPVEGGALGEWQDEGRAG
jgi:signal transduction histidine kinase